MRSLINELVKSALDKEDEMVASFLTKAIGPDFMEEKDNITITRIVGETGFSISYCGKTIATIKHDIQYDPQKMTTTLVPASHYPSKV